MKTNQTEVREKMKCCNQEMSEKEYSGISVIAKWKVCEICKSEKDRIVKDKTQSDGKFCEFSTSEEKRFLQEDII